MKINSKKEVFIVTSLLRSLSTDKDKGWHGRSLRSGIFGIRLIKVKILAELLFESVNLLVFNLVHL